MNAGKIINRDIMLCHDRKNPTLYIDTITILCLKLSRQRNCREDKLKFDYFILLFTTFYYILAISFLKFPNTIFYKFGILK